MLHERADGDDRVERHTGQERHHDIVLIICHTFTELRVIKGGYGLFSFFFLFVFGGSVTVQTKEFISQTWLLGP